MTVDTDQDLLKERIENTQLEFPERENGFTIHGSPFVCEFEGDERPEEVCEEITTWGEPWFVSGVYQQIGDDYWSLAGVLRHVEDGEQVGASEIDLEVCPEWVRVYVKKDCSAERVVEFVQTLDEELGVKEVKFSGGESDAE